MPRVECLPARLASSLEELLHGIFISLGLICKDDLLGGSGVRLEDANRGDVRLPYVTVLKTLPVARKLSPPPLLFKLVKIHTTPVPGISPTTIFGDGAFIQGVVKGGLRVIVCCAFNKELRPLCPSR